MAGRLGSTCSRSFVQNRAEAASNPSKLTPEVRLKSTPGVSNSVQMHRPNVHNLLNSSLIKSLEACPGKCSFTSQTTEQREPRSSTATTKPLHACPLHLEGLVGGQAPMAAPAKLNTMTLANILHKSYSFCFKSK